MNEHTPEVVKWSEDVMRPDFAAEETQAKGIRDFKALNDMVERIIEWAHTKQGKKWRKARPKK